MHHLIIQILKQRFKNFHFGPVDTTGDVEWMRGSLMALVEILHYVLRNEDTEDPDEIVKAINIAFSPGTIGDYAQGFNNTMESLRQEIKQADKETADQ